MPDGKVVFAEQGSGEEGLIWRFDPETGDAEVIAGRADAAPRSARRRRPGARVRVRRPRVDHRRWSRAPTAPCTSLHAAGAPRFGKVITRIDPSGRAFAVTTGGPVNNVPPPQEGEPAFDKYLALGDFDIEPDGSLILLDHNDADPDPGGGHVAETIWRVGNDGLLQRVAGGCPGCPSDDGRAAQRIELRRVAPRPRGRRGRADRVPRPRTWRRP